MSYSVLEYFPVADYPFICEWHLKVCWDNYKSFNDELKAFVSMASRSDLHGQACDAQERYNSKEARKLEGLLIGVKDNFCTKDFLTTAGSKYLSEFQPPYESTVTARIREAGGIIMGKTNMDEFGMGSATLNSYFGETSSPINVDLVAGGSSGGSACAVAKNMCHAAIGSDTGGSVRQPAAFCGLIGLKPTYGRVSRYGLISYASSFDTPGIINKNIYDMAAILEVIAGEDPNDSTCSCLPVPKYTEGLDKYCRSQDLGLDGLRVGIVKGFSFEETFYEGDEKEELNKILSYLESKRGFQVKHISIPYLEYSLPVYYILACAEASSNLARYDGVRYGKRVEGETLAEMYINTRSDGLGDEVKRRILCGTYVLSSGYKDAYYDKASKVRNLITNHVEKAFEEVDVILSPVTPTYPFRKDAYKEKVSEVYQEDKFTVLANLTGLPALSFPIFTKNERRSEVYGHEKDVYTPFSVQLMGKRWDELTLLRLGRLLELVTDNNFKMYGCDPSIPSLPFLKELRRRNV